MTNYRERIGERDREGRYPGAPAWNGDLETLSPAGLEEHDRGLQGYIANVTVRSEGWNDRRPWRVSTPAERRAAGLDRYVARLVEVRTERARREREIGFNEYLRLQASPAGHKPWPKPEQRQDVAPAPQYVWPSRADDIFKPRRFRGRWAVFDTYYRRHIRRDLSEAEARQLAAEYSTNARHELQESNDREQQQQEHRR
ncbi:hypothetical protein [Microlunatus parietis]|uniref:Uncharacterized protein n=1 Tax=Microlunatus parietis TaxID=682979 RepID=A0A7Y9LDT6_9ACTN|nr:hypothetical protein [Microlunatus parietis]NYE74252.1 hypothetical protein [Microlunatus parietis]